MCGFLQKLFRQGTIFRTLAKNKTVMENLLDRITFNPDQCGGKPCIRNMRIRVSDVLALLVNGLSAEQILEELPDLEAGDIKACLLYAARSIDHPVLKAA